MSDVEKKAKEHDYRSDMQRMTDNFRKVKDLGATDMANMDADEWEAYKRSRK